MSLHPHPLEPIPEETRRVALASFPKKSLIMRLREELGDLYRDEDFQSLFARRGRAAESPWRLALVTVMQAMEGLTDRQAADAVRGRLDWKYALSLSLEDAGFDSSVLCEFRQRLSEHEGQAQALLLDPLLEVCRTRGWLLPGGTQRTDSTHVLAAIRSLSSVESVGEAMRAALNELAVSDPDWLLAVMNPTWAERYVHRVDLVRLPKGEAARARFKAQIGQDVHVLLQALHESSAPDSLWHLASVQCLETIWHQHYEQREGQVCWRDGPAVSNAQRIVSPYDPQARASRKRDTEWVGYKVHLTETCPGPQEARPSLIVQVQTTAATVQDVEMTAEILEDVRQRGLAPQRVVADSAYQSGELLVEQRRLGTELSGPVGGSTSWQQRAQQGYSVAEFEVDWQREQATCPQGHTSGAWKTRVDRRGKDTVVVRFDSGVCRACEVREQCTHTKQGGRRLTLLPSEAQQAVEARRCEQVTPAFQQQYAIRAGIEATLSHGVRVMGLRASRYRGQAKTHVQHVSVAVALNLVRLDQFLLRQPQSNPSKRTTAFERLSQRIAS